MRMHNFSGVALALIVLLMATASHGQDAAPPPAPAPAPDAGAPPADPEAPAPETFSKEKLDQILAPIALYPDQLVTNMLMAASYPQDLDDAAKWLKEDNHASLTGDALLDAIRPLPWDPSVKFLLPFPQLVQQLEDKPDWAQDLGNAFINQQADVMAEVQHLRQLAESCGKLKSTAQMTVKREAGAITIAPANPATVYVPVYNPAVVYGAWPYPAYPPLYFAPRPGFVLGGVGFGLDVGIGYSVGFGVVGPLWGWSHPNWGGRFVSVDYTRVSRFTTYNRTVFNQRFAGGTWRHAGAARFGAARFSAAERAARHDNGRHVGWSHSAHGGQGHGHGHAHHDGHGGNPHAHAARAMHGGGHEGRGHGGGHQGGGHGHGGGGHGGHDGGHSGGGHGKG